MKTRFPGGGYRRWGLSAKTVFPGGSGGVAPTPAASVALVLFTFPYATDVYRSTDAALVGDTDLNVGAASAAVSNGYVSAGYVTSGYVSQ